MKKQRIDNYHFVYAILDVVIAFAVAVVSFLSYYGLNGFRERINKILMFKRKQLLNLINDNEFDLLL